MTGLRNRGEQPLAGLLAEHGLTAHDLVGASTEQITHKMVARGVKGRWLTPRVRGKLVRALNGAAGTSYRARELFNYGDGPPSGDMTGTPADR